MHGGHFEHRFTTRSVIPTRRKPPEHPAALVKTMVRPFPQARPLTLTRTNGVWRRLGEYHNTTLLVAARAWNVHKIVFFFSSNLFLLLWVERNKRSETSTRLLKLDIFIAHRVRDFEHSVVRYFVCPLALCSNFPLLQKLESSRTIKSRAHVDNPRGFQLLRLEK